ncbi:hypothetical protein HAX54_005518, partial [Datura stramonium]|nr:hypothetical protein [Datura stramonium]
AYDKNGFKTFSLTPSHKAKSISFRKRKKGEIVGISKEEMEEIGMTTTTNSEGEPGTQDKNTRHEHVWILRVHDEQDKTSGKNHGEDPGFLLRGHCE